MQMLSAAGELVKYSDRGGWVQPRRLHSVYYADVSAYACNCKRNSADKLPRSEVMDALRRLQDHCGVGIAGRVFSRKWQKSYEWQLKDKVDDTHKRKRLCPRNCVKH
ncbi:hypothetical protein F5Y19DRAFT_450939 [Xylariaceae sp. FL1651]|nr:hypothetical protein F5Y19DRAFT_450939 [Xylariaceae sp. FL1651]